MRTTKAQNQQDAGVSRAEASHRFVQHARVTAAVTVPRDTDELRVSISRAGLNGNAIENQSAAITLRRSELAGLASLFSELSEQVYQTDMATLGGKGNGSASATLLERNPGWLRREVEQLA